MSSTNTKLSNISKEDIPSNVQSQINPETKVFVPETDSKSNLPERAKEIEQPPEEIKIKEDGKFLDEAIDNLKSTLKGTKRKPTQIPQIRDEVTIRVEKIMEEGLADAFAEMTGIQKQEFKIKGEKTAMEIRNYLRGSKVKMKKIFQLLIDWLKLLPGVNRFFLEQEAKIKADKIISLKKINDNLNH